MATKCLPDEKRCRWMSVLAESDSADLEQFWERFGPRPQYEVVQGPETGLLMVQGRVGGTGARFCVGEVTVTRCTVVMPSGAVGTAMVLGCRPRHAEIAAAIDAALQNERERTRILEQIVAPLEQRLKEACQREASRVMATQVHFDTMVRGE
ncbi:MAG: phosphonate C-P lyase system protein PhnG [bacterium]